MEMNVRTYAGFERFRKALFADSFNLRGMDPITFGIQRNAFEIERLQKLIEAAEAVESATIQKRLPGWKREMQRLQETRVRFQSIN